MESERQYDGSRFNHHVCSDFSFEDHNPPTIKMILAFCQHAETQLKEMTDRTLVIHCKAGKVSFYIWVFIQVFFVNTKYNSRSHKPMIFIY